MSTPQFVHGNVFSHAPPRMKNEMLDVPHRTIRKITCLGSGFVGGKLSCHQSSDRRACDGLTFDTGPTSAVTAFKSNVEVTVVDINPGRIAAWNSDSLPIFEPGLHDIVKAARDGIQSVDESRSVDANSEGRNCLSKPSSTGDRTRRPNLFFSTDIDNAIRNADLIFVCVNTPTKANGVGKGAAADLGFVEAATRNIAKVSRESKIVVEKSTVPCRTAQSIREIVSLPTSVNLM